MTWHEWEGESQGLTYVRDGTRSGELRSLAEALRSDGVTPNLYEAFRLAESMALAPGFYGYCQSAREPVACDADGLTDAGDSVTRPIACVYAVTGD